MAISGKLEMRLNKEKDCPPPSSHAHALALLPIFPTYSVNAFISQTVPIETSNARKKL